MSSSIQYKRFTGSDQPLYFPLLEGKVIRLLELEPGTWTDPISIHLFVTELEFAPQYEALSYVWGDPLSRIPILCNGRTLEVTYSLHAAFRRVRLHDRPRILWADAVCINQEHLVERSYHVSFMADIYRNAQMVLVCLGRDPDGGAEDVASLIAEYAVLISTLDSITSMPGLQANDPKYDDPRWRSLSTLLNHVWFTRAWVIQEVGLAKDPRVLYGVVEFSYRDLMKLAVWITRCAPSLEARAGVSIYTIHTDWADWSPDWQKTSTYPNEDFLDLLNHCRWLGCTDPRDRVYAYLGHPLARVYPGRDLIVDPDYTKSVKDVYLDLAKQLIRRHGFRLLSAVEHDEQTLWDGFPSWVPFWSDVEWVSNSFGVFTEFYYDASSGAEPCAPTTDSEHNLIVRGVVVDTIRNCFRFTDADMASPTNLALRTPASETQGVLKDIWNATKYQETSVYPDSEAMEAFGLTLCAGLSTYQSAEDNIEQHRQDRAAYFRLLGPAIGCGDLVSAQISAKEGDAERFWVDMKLEIDGRSFICTQKGHYGLAPCIVKPGDVVCIFFGAAVPFVLRRADTAKPNLYKLVGECYIHNLMRGKALRGPGIIDDAETFVIC